MLGSRDDVEVEYVDRLIALLRTVGTPGLFALAFLDSAGLPTAGGPDVMILLLSARSQALVDFMIVALMAILGSVLGCLALYAVGRRGGRRVIARFSAERQEKIREKIERHGLWTIAVAVVAPPPYPMKLFMLSAGLFRMPLKLFVGAVLLGRTLRYFTVGYLAMLYGERAAAILRAHSLEAIGGLTVLIGVSLLASWLWRRRLAADPQRQKQID